MLGVQKQRMKISFLSSDLGISVTDLCTLMSASIPPKTLRLVSGFM
jgi:hypothetical protein